MPQVQQEVRRGRKGLLAILAGLGTLSLLTGASWFSTMEVSAPHINIQTRRIYDAPAPVARVADGAAGGGGGEEAGALNDNTGGAPGGRGAEVVVPAVVGGPAPWTPGARGCVYSTMVPTLSDCLLRPLAKSNVVINSVADKKYALYARNYVLALRAAGVTNYMMGALDLELLKMFKTMNAPSFSLANITVNSVWHATNRHKIRVVLAFIELGVGVLFTDIDVMFMADPMPFIDKWPAADQLISSDMQFYTARAGSALGLKDGLGPRARHLHARTEPWH
ncbi:hypothetical protein T492DRAFT_839828 [Pavlovales sp. CCMP2436]|nr:hypothetical protein T492DRAFT_839828 [Pavlovales sp. CCMP2436]